MEKDKLGLYLSFPFCRSKCTYCNFASGVYPASDHERYLKRLVEDIERSGEWASSFELDLPRTVDTIYLGGGTPSLLEPQLVHSLFHVIREVFDVEECAEITMECAPGQLPDATLEAMQAAGVNRVSLGVQSFVDREAQTSGRLHRRADVLQDLERLRGAGITNLNVDLIAGLAGQTIASWDESLAVLIESEVPHASIYMFEVDEDSRLGRELLAGGHRYFADVVPTEDTVAGMYERGIERLTEAGLVQYEISNFSRPDATSRHNLRYWQRRPYLGVGLDASSALFAITDSERVDGSSMQRMLLRSKTTDNLNAYLARQDSPEMEWLCVAKQFEEAWFLGLRLNRGVQLSSVRKEFGSERVSGVFEIVARLSALGLVKSDGENVTLTAGGRLLSNEVFQEFLFEAAPEAAVASSAAQEAQA